MTSGGKTNKWGRGHPVHKAPAKKSGRRDRWFLPHVRSPSAPPLRFNGLRMDKTPHEYRRERPTTGIQPMAFHDDASMPGHEADAHGVDHASMAPERGETTEALDSYRAKRAFEQTP